MVPKASFEYRCVVSVYAVSLDGISLTFPELGHTTGWVNRVADQTMWLYVAGSSLSWKRTNREYIHKKRTATPSRLNSFEGAVEGKGGGDSSVYLFFPWLCDLAVALVSMYTGTQNSRAIDKRG